VRFQAHERQSPDWRSCQSRGAMFLNDANAPSSAGTCLGRATAKRGLAPPPSTRRSVTVNIHAAAVPVPGLPVSFVP
jgi:hypothetical protein